MANIEAGNFFGMQLIERFQEWRDLRGCMKANDVVIDELVIRLYKGENDGLGEPYFLSGFESKQCRGVGGVLSDIREEINSGEYERAKIFVPSGSSYEMVLIGGRRSFFPIDRDDFTGDNGQMRPRF